MLTILIARCRTGGWSVSRMCHAMAPSDNDDDNNNNIDCSGQELRFADINNNVACSFFFYSNWKNINCQWLTVSKRFCKFEVWVVYRFTDSDLTDRFVVTYRCVKGMCNGDGLYFLIRWRHHVREYWAKVYHLLQKYWCSMVIYTSIMQIRH